MGGDVLASTRAGTVHFLDHLGVTRLLYIAQGNDLLFAVDFAADHADRVSEIIGMCARAYLKGEQHYTAMDAWHQLFLPTAKFTPKLHYFTLRAAFTLKRKIGAIELAKRMNIKSPSDLRLIEDPHLRALIKQGIEDVLCGDGVNAAQAFAMELAKTEADWSDRIMAAKKTPIWSVNGVEDPSSDVSVIDTYRAAYPWVTFEIYENAGQMLLFQHPDVLFAKIADAARRARV